MSVIHVVFSAFCDCAGIVTTLIERRHELKVLTIVASLCVGLESREAWPLFISAAIVLTLPVSFLVGRSPSPITLSAFSDPFLRMMC